MQWLCNSGLGSGHILRGGKESIKLVRQEEANYCPCPYNLAVLASGWALLASVTHHFDWCFAEVLMSDKELEVVLALIVSEHHTHCLPQ